MRVRNNTSQAKARSLLWRWLLTCRAHPSSALLTVPFIHLTTLGARAACCAAILLFSLPSPAASNTHTVTLSSPRLRLTIDSVHGITELADARSDLSMVATGGPRQNLWLLDIEGVSRQIGPDNARAFAWKPIPAEHGTTPTLRQPGEPGSAIQLRWSDFADLPGLEVEAVVELDPGQAMSWWSLRVSGHASKRLHAVRYPRLENLARQPDERLAVPVWMGQECRNPRQLLASPGARLEWSYPGLLSMQCLAFYAPHGPGFYLACDDTNAFSKTFAVFGGPSKPDANASSTAPPLTNSVAAGVEVVHLPQTDHTRPERWTMPYRVALGTFRGDWFTAAERYRDWAARQALATGSRLSRGLVPEWATNTALWVWNRGRSENVLDPARELQQKLKLPVSVFWHWWHGCSYDTGFPEYLPPREGAEPFRRALASAHTNTIHALVYMNQRLWGMRAASWTNENAQVYAVKDPRGNIHPEVYNTFTQAPCASMCMGTSFWRNKYAGLAEQALVQLGVDGIYMDQACSSLACYDPNHGHPVGGGTYWMNGFRLLQDEIRSRSARAKLPRCGPTLAGEGCGESWLPYLDLMLSLQVSKERYAGADGWEPIPFFHAVYHAFGLSYGNYSSLTEPPYDELWPAQFAPREPLKLLDAAFSRQFLMEQARAFVWGQQPTIANFRPSHFQQRPDEIGYVLRLARIRAQSAPFLTRGTFLRPPTIGTAAAPGVVPMARLEMSRLSIYAGQQGGVTRFHKECPLVYAAAWRAPDGAVAIALASIASEPLDLRIGVPEPLKSSPGLNVIWVDHKERRSLGGFPNADLPVRLPARGACLMELDTVAVR